MIFLGLSPRDRDFENRMAEALHLRFRENIHIMLEHGVSTLFIPCTKHENLERSRGYVDKWINHALKRLLVSDEWHEFYKEKNIRVRVYGDLGFIKDKGYPVVREWVENVESETCKNTAHTIFFGLACSNKYEIPRLMDLAVEFHETHGRLPSYEEKLKLYYGELVEDIEFLIRATALRDSDLQPPLVSGKLTQMYFLVSPDYLAFSEKVFRHILYDLLYCRPAILGTLSYEQIAGDDLDFLREFYLRNRDSVIGVGASRGGVWIPKAQVIGEKFSFSS
jgi:undecaprenyl pyrophosphate synthase